MASSSLPPPPVCGTNSAASLLCGEYCAFAPASALCFHYYTGGVCAIRQSFSCHRKQVTFNTAPHGQAPQTRTGHARCHFSLPSSRHSSSSSAALQDLFPGTETRLQPQRWRILYQACIIWSFNSLGVFMGAFPAFVKNNGSFFQGWKWYGSPRWSSLLMHINPTPSPSTVLYSMKILFSHVCSCCFSSILMDIYLLFYFTTNASCKCCVTLLSYALRLLQETFQAWQPSAVQTQLLPWSCFAL